MQSGRSGKQSRAAFERAFARVQTELAAGHLEEGLACLSEMVRANLFPEERRCEQHELMGQILYCLSDLTAALPHLKLAWELPHADHTARLTALSNYLMDLHYVDGIGDEELYAAHLVYETMLGDLPQFTHTGRCRKKLRIGYLSPNITDHVVLNFVIQLFAAYDRTHFAVYLYDIGTLQSEVTDWVAGMVDGYADLSQCSARAAAERIYADEIDILFDLAGHSAGGSTLRIAAHKPAPVQISGIGYFDTTGLSAVDYVLGDPYVDPQGMEERFAEQILRLPYTHLCFTPSDRFQPYEHLRRVPHDPVIFASFNNFAKITDGMLRLWAEILRRTPAARLLLKNTQPSEEVLARMRIRAERAGIDMDRLTLRPASKDYLRDYLEVDVVLDTHPYPGGGTTCEALFMGLPVVTMAGSRHGARFGAGLLHNVGLSELAADCAQAYVECAVALGTDMELLAALHAAIPRMMRASPLMDGIGYVRAVEAAYKTVWERYLNEET